MTPMVNKGDSLPNKSDEWETPGWLFEQLNKEFDFNLDACATIENTKCIGFYDKEVDGLKNPWERNVWMNPPYSQIEKWMAKAYNESCRGTTVVCLVFARTDTKWWHKYVMKANEIRFISGRVAFLLDGEVKNRPAVGSCIVVFRPKKPQNGRPLVSSFQRSNLDP